MEITAEHRALRNQASIDLADSGATVSTIKFFDVRNGQVLAVRHLAKPCAVLTPEGRISLQPAGTSDLVTATGSPTWAEWCNADGDMIAGGAVTDITGAGPFKLAGTASGVVYEGGLLELALPALLG